MKSSWPDPAQSAKVYISCLPTHLVRSSSLCNESWQYTSCAHFIKMDKLEYHAVIKFFILDGLAPEEIYPNFNKVHGNSDPSISLLKSGQLNLNMVVRCPKMTHVKDGQKL